jgi:molybdopterin-guanine dinucleotide biosynthesis protein A
MRVAGILVGGAAIRMNGAAKGLLTTTDGESIIARTRRLFEAEGARVVLLGGGAAYEGLGLPFLSDEPDASGPLSGLLALLRRSGAEEAYLVGCDMPHLTPALVARLTQTTAVAQAGAVAARVSDRWEPLFSGYSVHAVKARVESLVHDGARSPSAILDGLSAEPLSMSADEARALADWDTPEDVTRDVTGAMKGASDDVRRA